MNDSSSKSCASSLTKPSSTLMSAALVGLLTASVVAACSDTEKSGVGPSQTEAGAGGGGAETPSGAGAGGADTAPADGGAAGAGVPVSEYNNVISDGEEITAAQFQALCDERNGWVYVTAFCAGAGMCKGLSLLGTTLTDHSCKGLNSCGGAGCVVLPEDAGLTGKEIYSAGPCGNCHGDWSDYENPNFNVYTIVHGSELTGEQAETRFKTSTDQRLLSILIFGTQGLHPDGTPYSNMPAYYQKYSLAEIKRTLEYVKSLPTATAEYEIFGVTPGFGIPEAPAEGGAGGAPGTAAGGAGGQGG